MESKPTHIVQSQASQNSEILYRADDGMRIAHRKDRTVIFGEDPHKSSGRYFVDAHTAHVFVETLAANDLKERSVDAPLRIDYRDIEDTGIVIAADMLEFPGGAPRAFKN